MASSSCGQEKAHDFHWELINCFEPLLREYFIPSHIMSHLCPIIKQDGMMQVKKAEKNSIGDGVSKLLELLKASGDPGWFEAFIEALKREEYDLLADHLCGTRELKNRDVFRELLGIFCDQIMKTVDPKDITVFLLEKNTITKEDFQEINRVSREDDTKSGILLLLTYLPQHSNYWFADFIAALKHVKTQAYQALAADIAPAVDKACSIQKEREVADEFQALNEEPRTSTNTVEHASSMTSSPEGTDMDTITEFQEEYEEMDTETSPLGAGIDTAPKHYPDGEYISSQTSSSQNIPMENVKSHLAERGEWSISKSINNLSAPGPKKIIKRDIVNVTGDMSDDCCEGSEVVGNELPADIRKSQRQANSNVDNKPKPLELRSYQKELAEPAVSGKNVIIVAPTGSGKTHVALYITQDHFTKPGRRRVVFFVPTTELVSQQTQMYCTYLCDYKVYGLSGNVQESQKLPISSLIDKYDILVMTPQILLNALQKKDVLSLSIFTLIIFDECHHTTKEHPYNNIMAIYLDEKCREDRDYFLPQIVGLTASVGVGGARDTDGATKHILSLCANLDATDGISVVEKHKKELQQFVNKPNEEKIETHGRQEDPFRDIINSVMAKIEGRIRDHIDKQNISHLTKLMDVPTIQRGSDKYTQWLSILHKESAKIYEQDIRRPIYACRAHLTIYNTALMINEDCRTADSLSYLLKEFRDINPQHKDETDNWLEGLFNCHRNELAHISDDPRYANPKLNKLGVLLLDKYKGNEDMRAIVFCKTREMTMALQKWIEETPELAVLSPNRLVGATASAEKGGMTQNKQEDVLTHFKGGRHKVIIATSVAEEGLDVSKCNLVIRYEYISNEIAMVQARGRGRAESSDYIVLGDHSRGAAQKEEMNKIKENMMNKAIQMVNGMADETRRENIQMLQKETMELRKMNAVTRMMKAEGRPRASGNEWELRCFKCDALGCLANDIRLFENSHHMVLDESFPGRIIVEPHPNPKQVGEILKTDKIFCKECHTDWGIRVIYKTIKLCVIKVNAFRVINTITNAVFTPRKWINAPFAVANLTSSELEQYAKACHGQND